MSTGRELWAASKVAVAKELGSSQHAIASTVKTVARDAKSKAPRALASSVGALVPFPLVGSILNAAIAVALQKQKTEMLKVQQKVASQKRAADPQDFQLIRKAADADLKHAVEVLGLLVANHEKLVARVREAESNCAAFNRVAAGPLTYEKVYDAGWGIACSLQYLRHYEDKCRTMIEVMRQRLDVADEYLNACGKWRRDARAAVIKNVDLILDPDPSLAAMGMGRDSPATPVTKRLLSGGSGSLSDDFD